MSIRLNLNERLDFSDIDLTAPDVVIAGLLSQLPSETNGLICGKIQSYTGPVMSYTKSGISSIARTLGTKDAKVDIQNDLGKIGEETHKFECYLYTSGFEQYRYRMFFIKYNISNYPVTVVLEESIAKSISVANGEYVIVCNNRDELEELLVNVLTSKRVIMVMQELIRVNQAQKLLEKTNAAAENGEDAQECN